MLSLGLVAAVILIPGAVIARRRRGTARLDGFGGAARILAWSTGAMKLFFLAGLFAVFTDPGVINGVPGAARWIFWLPIAGIPLTLGAAWLIAREWIHIAAGSVRPVWLTIAVAGQASLLAWLFHWNVLFYAFSLAR